MASDRTLEVRGVTVKAQVRPLRWLFAAAVSQQNVFRGARCSLRQLNPAIRAEVLGDRMVAPDDAPR
jgi:hypothetical protein